MTQSDRDYNINGILKDNIFHLQWIERSRPRNQGLLCELEPTDYRCYIYTGEMVHPRYTCCHLCRTRNKAAVIYEEMSNDPDHT
jgi:hypothetical protein